MVQPHIVWSSVSHFSEVEVGGRSMEKEELVTLILCLMLMSVQLDLRARGSTPASKKLRNVAQSLGHEFEQDVR